MNPFALTTGVAVVAFLGALAPHLIAQLHGRRLARRTLLASNPVLAGVEGLITARGGSGRTTTLDLGDGDPDDLDNGRVCVIDWLDGPSAHEVARLLGRYTSTVALARLVGGLSYAQAALDVVTTDERRTSAALAEGVQSFAEAVTVTPRARALAALLFDDPEFARLDDTKIWLLAEEAITLAGQVVDADDELVEIALTLRADGGMAGGDALESARLLACGPTLR